MSKTYRRRPWNANIEWAGDKRFSEKVTCRADKWHSPQCVTCGNSDVQKRAKKRGERQRAMIQELKDSD